MGLFPRSPMRRPCIRKGKRSKTVKEDLAKFELVISMYMYDVSE